MEKDFDARNDKKKRIHNRGQIPYFHEREVWWCTLGLNVGSEQDGGNRYMRPILILKKFNQYTFWGIPLTTSKSRNPYLIKIPHTRSLANLSQLRLISTKRLESQMYVVSEDTFKKIVKGIRSLLPRV
jgi:mRNA interferase MazF